LSLHGKTVVITGATGRIGQPLVEACARAGATLAITTRRQAASSKLEQDLQQRGITAAVLPCDLLYEEDVVRAVHRLSQRFGKIDVVINAAITAGPRLSALNYPMDPWREVIATNVNGTFLVCREVLPWMIRQQSGSIINVTDSHAGPRDGKSAAYLVSMQTVDHLTRLLAAEAKGTGVRINAVDIAQLAPPSRTRQQPSDWTETFVWLADDESAEVTGQRIEARAVVKAS